MLKTILILTSFIIFSTIFCSGSRPSNIGIKDNKLTPCPDSPNCVSSEADDKEHFIEPFPITGSGSAEMKKILDTIKNMKRTEIIESTDNYIYAEFTSAVFRFVDDVEF